MQRNGAEKSGTKKVQCDKYNTLTLVLWSSLPKGFKVLTTMWAMKMMSTCTHHRRLNARGSEQVNGSDYASDSIAMHMSTTITV